MKHITLAAAVLLLPVAVQSQQGPPPAVRGGMGMATRPVAQYTELEQRLMESFQSKDEGAARNLLSNDFEVRLAEQADSIGLADWLHDAMTARSASFRIHNLSVREFSDVDIVSFLLDRNASAQGKRQPHTEFVVDIWNRDDHRLVTRYVSVPSHPLPASNRPDGR